MSAALHQREAAPAGALTWHLVHSPRLAPAHGLARAVDAYLLWDEQTDFARHRRAPDEQHAPVLLELAHPAALGAAAPAAANPEPAPYVVPLRQRLARSLAWAPNSSVHTVLWPLDPDQLALLDQAQADGVVRRYEVGAPCRLAPQAVPQRWPAPGRKPPLRILGVVDDGCCLAHADWRGPAGGGARSRLLALWDQDTAAVPSGGLWQRLGSPSGAGPDYGVELTAPVLNRLLDRHPELGEEAEQAVYRALERDAWGGPDRRHGAKVMQLLGGAVRLGDVRLAASDLPLVFVQLPERAVADTSGDSLPMHVVDGARYIAQRCSDIAGTAPLDCTINLSLGSLGGPHDGSAMVDLALAELASRPGVRVVAAAGNAGDHQRVHALRNVGIAQPATFQVRISPDNPHDSLIEFWLPDARAAAACRVTVQSPAGEAFLLPPLQARQMAVLKQGPGLPLAALVFAQQVAHGSNGTMLLLAVGPTAGDGTRTTAAAGLWTVALSAATGPDFLVQAWVERDDIIVGARRAQTTRFEPAEPLPEPATAPTVKAPATAQAPAGGGYGGYLSNAATLSSLAHAAGLVVAGGHVLSTQAVADYCGNGPGRLSPAQDGRPTHFAPTESTPTQRGIDTAGFYSGQHEVVNGTSAAAPLVARWLAEGRPLQPAANRLSPSTSTQLPLPVDAQVIDA